MTFQEAIQYFIEVVDSNELTTNLNATEDENVQRVQLPRVLSAVVDGWVISSDINKKHTDINRIKTEFLAVMAIPGALDLMESTVHRAMVEAINRIETMSLMDQTIQSVDDRFFPTFFRNLLTQENSDDRVVDIEVLMQLNFLQRLACFPMGQGETVLRIIFSKQGTAKADALIKKLFELNVQSGFTMPALTRVLSQQVAKFDEPLQAAVRKLKEQLGDEHFRAVCDHADTGESFKAVARPLLTAKASTAAAADPEKTPAEKAQDDLAWLMSAERTVADLTSKSPRAAALQVHDQAAFVQALTDYAAQLRHLSKISQKEKIEEKDKGVEYKRAKRLAELLVQLSVKTLEADVGESIASDLSVIALRGYISIYKEKNKQAGKVFSRWASSTGQSQTDEKELFLEELLNYFVFYQEEQDTSRLQTDEDSQHHGEIAEGIRAAEEAYKQVHGELCNDIVMLNVHYHLNTSKDKKYPTAAQLDEWVMTRVIEGVTTKKALSWFTEAFLMKCAVGLPRLQVFLGVKVDATEKAVDEPSLVSAAEHENSVADRKRRHRVSVLRSVLEDSAVAEKNVDSDHGHFSASSSTLAGAGAKQADDNKAAKQGAGFSSIFGFGGGKK